MNNIFTNIKKFFTKTFGNDSSYSSLTGGGFDTPLANNLSSGNLMNQNKNWVFTCVHKIATSISGIELHLKKYNSKGDDTEIFEHKVIDLLDNPNRLMTGRDFKYTIAGHMQLTGNAYILKDEPKNPTQMFPLNPSMIKPVWNDEMTDIIEYEYRAGTKTFKYPFDRIIHLKKPNLKNPFMGAGVIEHIPEWIDIDSAALEFNRLFFKNGASPSGILETEATDMKALELAKAGFEMRYQGALNSHKTAILSKGSKYTSNSATPRDMEFAELDNRFRDKILSAFGVPKSVLGIVEDVNRANAEASYFVFMLFTIDPEMKMLVAYINEKLLPSFTGTENLYFTYDNIIPDNDAQELNEDATSLGGGQAWKTINEIRSKEGLPPIDNGDFVYGGFSTIPIGSVKTQPSTNNSNTPTEKKKMIKTERIKKFEKKERTIDSIVDALDVNKLSQAIRKESDEIIHKEFIARVSQFENKFIKSVKKFDEKIKEEVLANLEDGKKDYSKKDVFNVDKARTLFIGFTSGILQDLLKTEGQAQMDRLDTTQPFNPMAESVQNKLKGLLGFSAQSYSDTTLKLLNGQLSEGIANGESLADLTQRVAQVFSLSEQYRAERVARTTVFATANASAREAYKQSGVVKTVVWHTAEDELVCPECEPMDGKEIDVDGEFMNGLEDPPLHVNCRCFANAGEIKVERNVQPIIEKETTLESDNEETFLEKMLEVLK